MAPGVHRYLCGAGGLLVIVVALIEYCSDSRKDLYASC